MPEIEDLGGGESLEAAAQRLATLTLDTLVIRGRDEMRIRLATDADIQALAADIEVGPWVKAELAEWRLFAVEAIGVGVSCALLGTIPTGQGWITSQVLKVDLKQGFATTASGSLYRLGTRGIGEPPHEQVLLVASQLSKAAPALAARYGIPHVFY